MKYTRIMSGICVGCIMLTLTGAVSQDAQYSPGETLNPTCSPSDKNCSVSFPNFGNNTNTSIEYKPLSFATYVLQDRSDPGSLTPPQGPADNWKRIGAYDLIHIDEGIHNGITKWGLQPGRYELTASLRVSSTKAAAMYSWFNERTGYGVGGTALLKSMDEGSTEGATTVIKAIVEPTVPTTYYIRQETGDFNDDLLPSGSWVTIKQISTTQVINPNTWDITGFKDYSKQPQDTQRKWVDGKTIYKKVVEWSGEIDESSQFKVSHVIDDIDSILPESSVVLRKQKDNVYGGGGLGENSYYWKIDADNITIFTGSDIEFDSGFIAVIYYTKK